MKKYISELEQFGITELDYKNAEVSLTKKFNKKPFESDIIWFLYNTALNNVMKNSDFKRLSQIYYSMAIFMNKEKKNRLFCLEKAENMR